MSFLSICQTNMSINFNNHYRFFHLQVIRYNLFTKKHSVHVRDNDNLCTFCNNEPEELLHLLFQCHHVQSLITSMKNNITQLYDFDNSYLMDPQKFLLGKGIKKADNKTFLLTINIARFVWISKHDSRPLTLDNFKFFFNSFLRIQKLAGVLREVRDVDIDSIWST